MKRFFYILLSVILMLTLFCGCNRSVTTATVDLSKEPIAEDKNFELTGGETLQFEFILPEAGYIKLLAFDSTEYEIWPGDINKACLEFVDKSGKVLHKIDDISNGYTKKMRFEKGTVLANLTFDKKFKDMKSACVSWGFAADTESAQKVTVGGGVCAASTNKNKNAFFTFSVDEDGMYDINCGELCTYESNSYFTLESKTDTIATRVFIHETEWYYRKFFLTKGDYTVTASDIEGVARCTVKKSEKQPSNIHTQVPSSFIVAKSPIAFGNVTGEQKIKGTFTADSSVNRLCIDAMGPGTFYDSEQTFSLVIKNASGKVVFEEDECEPSWIDISKYKGDYTFTLTAHGNGVYEFKLYNYVEE